MVIRRSPDNQDVALALALRTSDVVILDANRFKHLHATSHHCFNLALAIAVDQYTEYCTLIHACSCRGVHRIITRTSGHSI
jgi:hypothetical protein